MTGEVRAIRPCVGACIIFLQAVDQNAGVGISVRILNLRLTIEITVRVESGHSCAIRINDGCLRIQLKLFDRLLPCDTAEFVDNRAVFELPSLKIS